MDLGIADAKTFLALPYGKIAGTDELAAAMHNIIAQGLVNSGDYVQALNELDASIQLAPKEPGNHLYRANTQKRLGRFKEALEDLGQFERLGGKLDAEDKLMKAELLMKADRYQEGNALLTGIIKQGDSSGDKSQYYWMAFLYRSMFYDLLDQTEKAFSDINTYVDHMEATKQTELTGLGYTYRSSLLNKRGNFARAYAEALNAIQITPKAADAFAAAGDAALSAGKPAVDYFRKAIVLGGKGPKLYGSLGAALALDGENEQALQAAESALKAGKGDANSLTEAAKIYRLTGDSQRALDACNKAIALTPDFKLAYGERGFTWLALKQWAKATEDFQRYPDKGISKAGMVCLLLVTEKSANKAYAFASGSLTKDRTLYYLYQPSHGLPYVKAKRFLPALRKLARAAGY